MLKKSITPRIWINKKVLPILFASIFLTAFSYTGTSQNCPPNIDFETGTFNGWTCYRGFTAAVGDRNEISLFPTFGPVAGSHTMYTPDSRELDEFGRFPVNCPNGSGYSIKLGSTEAGGQAEGVSYEFTIPPNENSYSLIYNYAVVFQSPNHRENEQPRMEIEITNVTDNETISCASFSFIAVGSGLPGFSTSAVNDTTIVLYKGWTPVSVDLSGNAGKRIRLFFKTADCTFRRHFGYAYLDVNSECSGTFTGATFCPDDTEINVLGHYGFREYTWYDSSLTNVLGTQQNLRLAPPPPSGTTIALKLEPYEGYGCSKTLFTTLNDSLTVIAHAGEDRLSCNRAAVPIGVIPKPGLRYTWSPTIGLSNSTIANPRASPSQTTSYVVTTTNSGGGCRTTDTVVVRASIIDDSMRLVGKPAYCLGDNDSAVLHVQPTASIQWFRDSFAITQPSQTTRYRINASGSYHALLKNDLGCSITTKKQAILIEPPQPGMTYPVEYALINQPLDITARLIGERVLWRPATNLNDGESFAPTFKGATDQFYTIEIKTKAGCVTVDSQLVRTIEKVNIFVPTAFTPNKDGKNDYLRPALYGLKDLHFFRVFNRLGQLLYESRNALPGWDGVYKGTEQTTQTVVWMVKGVGIDGTVHTQKGTAVLLRQ